MAPSSVKMKASLTAWQVPYLDSILSNQISGTKLLLYKTKHKKKLFYTLFLGIFVFTINKLVAVF